MRELTSRRRRIGGFVFLWIALAVAGSPAVALDRLLFVTPSASDELRSALRAASLTVQAEAEKQTNPQTLFASARADYGRLLGALYAEGYYSGVIRIEIDGREASAIAPLDAPSKIREIRIRVEPGPRFTFSKARMRPYAPGTALPSEYGDTKVAKSTAIVDAATAGVEGWRNVGHAKARVAGQDIVADHRGATIASQILLEPGPRVRFGALRVSGYQRMDPQRLRKIAGFPTGEVYDPEELQTVAKRLRRTGVFSSVSLTEAERVGPDGTLDVDLVVAEEKLRRFGVGAEVSSTEGLNLSGYWLHRNLLGGAERLRIDGEVSRIGGAGNIIGYSLGARIERPATPVTDASAFVEVGAKREEVFGYAFDSFDLTLGLSRILSDTLTAEAGLSYSFIRADYPSGTVDFKRLALPLSLTWDKRDDPLDARNGFFLRGDAAPFLGFGATGSGAQLKTDARAYRSFGSENGLVLAGRLQLGTVVGSSLIETPPDYLFFSGGGGTVRGQPYQSLGAPIRTGGVSFTTGGLSFAGLSAEVRADITKSIGAVAFYDAGFVSDGELFGGTGNWHTGAGVGVRYDTGIGPIRLDIGLPLSGDTGSGAQIYIGIGQSF
ncbi:MAG: autotransporter assembly complex family protein [Paracoccaceae bacterium]